jgi:hypothetical protein
MKERSSDGPLFCEGAANCIPARSIAANDLQKMFVV